MPEVRVQPRSVYEHHIFIKKAHTTLNWTFSTKKKSICFGLYYRPGNTTSSTRTSIDETPSTIKRRNLSLPKLRKTATNVPDFPLDSSVSSPTTPSHEDFSSDHDDHPAIVNKRLSMVSTHPTIRSTNKRQKSSSAISVSHLLDNDFIELIPIDQVNSSKEAIVGSFLAEEPGNYILIFDNMFSRNTSKTLTFTVTSDEPIFDAVRDLDHDMSGWLLKKRRKRMQGWAKRWFELSSTGVLSYSVHKGDIKRGSLQIMLATIAISPKQRTMHVDSGTTLFHLKALTAQSFDQWLQCIRARRSVTTTESLWHQDALASATSLVPELITTVESRYKENHQVIAKTLMDMDTDIKRMQMIMEQLINEGPATSIDANSLPQPPPPPVHSNSSNSIKLIRFPFIRSSSNNHIEHQNRQQTIEKLVQYVKAMSTYRDKLSTAYYENYDDAEQLQQQQHPLDVPSRTGTGFLSHRSASFYSYSVHSDQFFDAEDVFLSNEDNESTNGSIDVDSEDEEDHNENNTTDTMVNGLQISNNNSNEQVSRRKRLPHPVAVKSISVLGILRKNIGKDLSTISMPISLNEPLNLLQRLCEELEYSELLDKAFTQTSSMDRLIYVTVFAISTYASSQYRIGRKPFNPLLGETYECIRPDKGFRFIAEKVSHHPNVMACHAESDYFVYSQSYFGKTQFWGKSMELITEGQTHIQLKRHMDAYTFSKPSSWLRNLVTGTKYLETIGEMKVNNHTTGEYAVVTFKEATPPPTSTLFSTFSNNAMYRNQVIAKFYDCRGSLIRQVQGKWSESLFEEVAENQYSVLWRCQPPSNVEHCGEDYGLTDFAVQLNEMTSLERGMIPMTDTRLRPDQCLFENGKVAEAEDEKIRVEQLQRERRKQLEAQNATWEPIWFELKEDAHSATGDSWQYKGKYWENRASGQWPKEILKLW